MLSRPVNRRLSSRETGSCLSMLDALAAVGSSVHRLFCSFLCALVSHGPYRQAGPSPGSGFERRVQLLRERVLS